MMVEVWLGRGGLTRALSDATPFAFHESGDKVSVDYFGEELQAAGYNWARTLGGVSGCVCRPIFIQVVYHQRLRHMVFSKYQGSSGPTNELTRQPIKGRKKGSGIRLGGWKGQSLESWDCLPTAGSSY
jgi:DNA-directed RNA polymerase I subunit RPA2